MTALTPLQRLWLTETVRLREEHAGPLDDQEANRLARNQGGDLATEGGLRLAEFARGRRQRAGFCRLEKGAQLVPVDLIHT